MVDEPPSPQCRSAGPSKCLEQEIDSRPSASTTAPSPPIVPPSDNPNPQTFPPMEREGVIRLPPIHVPAEEDRPLHMTQPYGKTHPQHMSPPFYHQNGSVYPGPAPVPMEPSAIYPMPFMPTMGFYPPVMPMPYGGYHPHPGSYRTPSNDFSTQQHFIETNGYQSQFNNAYQPPHEIVSLPDESMNRLGSPKPSPNSADPMYKEAENQPPLPSFRSLENATIRSFSGEPSQVPPRCRSPPSNLPPAKKRRVEISGPGSSEIQANGMERSGPVSIEKAGSRLGNEKQQCSANACIGSPSNPNRSEKTNAGSTQKSTAGSPKKSCGSISIKDIVHPSEMPSPPPNPTQTRRSDELTASRNTPQDARLSTPIAPYPTAPVVGVPHHIMSINNMGSHYFGNPHHELRHYPSLAKMMYPRMYPQGYGSNVMGMHPHQEMLHRRYAGQRLHPMTAGYSNRSSDNVPQPNRNQNGYGSGPSMSPPPVRQHAVQIAPAPSGSSQGILGSSSAQGHPTPGVESSDRLYDIAAIEKLGCKVLKWRVYNEQGHPVCAAPRENGVPCRRNVSRSACKWHGLVVPLRPNNTINGRLDAQGNLIQSFTPPAEVPEEGPPEDRAVNDRSLRSRALRSTETPETHSRVHRWTDKEHFLFLLGHKEFGKSWAKISKVVQSRTTLQTQSHAQKFFERRRKQEKKKSTIHDLVFESPEMQAIYNSTAKEVLDGYLARAFGKETDQNAEEQSRDQGQANANSDE